MMATITLQTSLAGPTDNAGTCRVFYQIVESGGIDPAVLVVKYYPPRYQGGDPTLVWQHVAYADEMTTLPTEVANPKQQSLVRKATAIVEYPSLDAARTAINSIRSQIQRLVNEVDVLEKYTETQTFVISSID